MKTVKKVTGTGIVMSLVYLVVKRLSKVSEVRLKTEMRFRYSISLNSLTEAFCGIAVGTGEKSFLYSTRKADETTSKLAFLVRSQAYILDKNVMFCEKATEIQKSENQQKPKGGDWNLKLQYVRGKK